jgi:hypothetical protein
MPRLRFSLRAFFLVLLIGTLVGSHLFTSLQFHQSHQENAEMRKELGRLVIKEEEMVHVIAVPAQEDMLWRWRIYVPKGSGHHEVCVATQGIPENGFPESIGTSTLLPEEGEHLLTAAIRPGHSGDLRLTITWGKASSSFGIAENDARWLLAENRGFSSHCAGSDGAEKFDPHQPIVLLRMRAMEPARGGGYAVSSDTPPGDGAMIWIRK